MRLQDSNEPNVLAPACAASAVMCIVACTFVVVLVRLHACNTAPPSSNGRAGDKRTPPATARDTLRWRLIGDVDDLRFILVVIIVVATDGRSLCGAGSRCGAPRRPRLGLLGVLACHLLPLIMLIIEPRPCRGRGRGPASPRPRMPGRMPGRGRVEAESEALLSHGTSTDARTDAEAH